MKTLKLRTFALATISTAVASLSPTWAHADPVAVGTSIRIVPTPINLASSQPLAWGGSKVDLMVADAFAACSEHPVASSAWDGSANDPSVEWPPGTLDNYLASVYSSMAQNLCSDSQPGSPFPTISGQDVLHKWFVQRSVETLTTESNVVWHNPCLSDGTINAATGMPNPAVADLRQDPVVDTVLTDHVLGAGGIGYPTWMVLPAARAVRRASVNLCIAAHLRSTSPGAAGGESMLYSAVDQRQMLEVIVERSRIAMLQYAGLAMVFSTPSPNPDPFLVGLLAQVMPSEYIPLLQSWAQAHAGDQTLQAMGDDFANAVHLNIQASNEMAELLARSASAHLGRGGAPFGPIDEMWGYESWRQRLLASLYGGEPLADNVDHSAPWISPWDDGYPGSPIFGVQSPAPADRDFPSIVAQPYVTADVTDPLVGTLESLAYRFDVMNIRQGGASNGAVPLDPDGSALRLYMAVEAGLRTADCDVSTGGQCQVVDISQLPVPDGSNAARSYTSFDLWNRFHITPDHATQLARRMASYLGGSTQTPTRDLAGALNFNGQGSIVMLPDENSNPASYYHVPAGSSFAERKVQQLAPLYTGLGRYHMPDHIEAMATAQFQGVQDTPAEVEGARRMGTIGALDAVRYGLWRAYNNAPSSADTGLLKNRAKILALIDGAIGEAGFSVSPAVQALATASGSIATVAAQPSPTANTQTWHVHVSTGADDTWWDASNPVAYTLYAVPSVPWDGNALLFPKAQSFVQGLTAASLRDPHNGAVTGTLAGAPGAPAGATGTNFWEFNIDLPNLQTAASTAVPRWTFFVFRSTPPTDSGAGSSSYALLGSGLGLSVFPTTVSVTQASGPPLVVPYTAPYDGHWIGYNGQLTQLEHRMMAMDSFDPAQPAFDAFGLPLRWSPPTNPALFGAAPGTSAVQHYLDRATQAATDATSQVKDAISTLLQQQQDHAALAAAVQKSAEVSQLQQEALCGTAKPNCDTSLADVKVDVEKIWDDVALSMIPTHTLHSAAVHNCTQVYPILSNPSATDVQQRLDCVALSILTVIPPTFRLAKAVADHQFDTSAPTFSDYQGGTFQHALVDQWTALRTLQGAIRTLLLAKMAAEAQTAAFATKVQNDQKNWDDVANSRCSPQALEKDTFTTICGMVPSHNEEEGGPSSSYQCFPQLTGVVANVPASSLTWDDAATTSTSVSVGGSFGISLAGVVQIGGSASSSTTTTAVPLASKVQFCEQLEQTLGNDWAQAIAGAFSAHSNLAAQGSAFVQQVGALLLASAEGGVTVQQTRLAKAQADMDAELLASSQVSRLPIYRQTRSYDVWRAQALLDAARIAGITARRAIESHYVVDMSRLVSPEAFVAAPNTWADEAYQYDLSLPAAVGLDVGTSAPDGVYPNQVADFVGNLSSFVNGFAIQRPSAVASDDLDVLSLPGPVGLVTSGAATGANAGAARVWSYECPSVNASGRTWRPLAADGNPNDSCLPDATHPTSAKVEFSLDPWARVNGDIALDPFTKRYNARWSKFSVNIVGTGVLDCSKAIDPNACYASAFVPYGMTVRGPVWASDWNQSWTVLGVPVGQIDSGKALAAELWLDPLANNFSQSSVAAVARSEFAERPFGGQYEIVLATGPEVQLGNIQRLQILVDSNYWVKQQ